MATKKIDTSFEIARYFDNGVRISVTIKQYFEFLNVQDKDAISNMVYHRLHARYIKPFVFDNKSYKKEFKNGFSIMANCCLLIETLHSFKHGWGDSNGRSGQAFKDFFESDSNFKELKSRGSEIYTNIRCGILHQGETINGWKIDRGNKSLIDGKTIHAVAFQERLEKSLNDYKDLLRKEKWDSEHWDNFRTKMRKIISNCA
jgi:hypothetical protein